jgi:hypothetical protein
MLYWCDGAFTPSGGLVAILGEGKLTKAIPGRLSEACLIETNGDPELAICVAVKWIRENVDANLVQHMAKMVHKRKIAEITGEKAYIYHKTEVTIEELETCIAVCYTETAYVQA